MTQTRRKVLGGIVAGVTATVAGCSGTPNIGSTSGTKESDEIESNGDEFEYINSVESTVIGKNQTSEPAVIVSLTDFAVSKHSAATEIVVYSGEQNVGQTLVTDSKSLTIPISKGEFDVIRVADDSGTTLSEYSA